MTADWFEDLAQRLSEASLFAFYDDDASMGRDFQMARQSALDYASSIRAAVSALTEPTSVPGLVEIAGEQSGTTPNAARRRVA